MSITYHLPETMYYPTGYPVGTWPTSSATEPAVPLYITPDEQNPSPESVIKDLILRDNGDGTMSILYNGQEYPIVRILSKAHNKKGKTRYDIALLEDPKEKIYSVG